MASSRDDLSPQPGGDAGLRRALAIAGGLVFLLLLGRLWWLPAHAPLDVNEGWNAMQAMRAWETGGLYPSPDALTANNYPPLSFYIVGLLGLLIGDNIVAGRLVALAAQMLTGAAVFTAVRRIGHGRVWAWAGVVLFAAFSATLLRGYAAMNDPQWLAEACMAWAMAIVLPAARGAPVSPRAIPAAALLVVMGIMIKHNAVAIPLAVTVWLMTTDRRQAAIWAISGAVLTGLACCVIWRVWGTDPFFDVLAEARNYSVPRMLSKSALAVIVMLPAVLGCAPLWRHRRQPEIRLPLLLLAVALPIGIVQCAGDGVDVNAFFEAVVAISVALPVACALDPLQARKRLIYAFAPLVLLVPSTVKAGIAEFTGRAAAVHRWRNLTMQLAAIRGPVACDDQAVCYWAGRDAGMDLFILKQRLAKGGGQPFVAAINNRDFKGIELRTNDRSWSVDLARPLIRAQYRIVYADSGAVIMVPRD